MAPLPTRLAKEKPLPGAGVWFLCQDEAMTHRGVLIELRVSDPLTLYGVYPTQNEFCTRAAAFIKKRPTASTVPQLKTLVTVHTQITQAFVKTMGLNARARWFTNELGALTAFTLSNHAHFARLLMENNRPGFDPTKPETYTIFYGLFDDRDHWIESLQYLPDKFVLDVGPPFVHNTLDYDRTRCTILRARGALIKAPRLNPMTEAEMDPFVNLVPPALFWFRTKEDALDMAGYTAEYRMNDAAKTTLYGVYGGVMDFFELCALFSAREREHNRHERQYTMSVIQDPEGYDRTPDEE